MLFNSLQFLFFFSIVLAAYFTFPDRWKVSILLMASCYFYMVLIPKYILILFAVILVDFFAGIMIEQSKGALRRFYLFTSIVANLGILSVFKYGNFFLQNYTQVTGFFGNPVTFRTLEIVLPIGLSFHVFQSLSYTIEVYRGSQIAERNFSVYALYVMFFPQLVAGPIERPQNMLHQFHNMRSKCSYGRIMSGLNLVVWGLFKKMVIADRLAEIVDPVYNRPAEFSRIALIIATYAFAIQIYCDFSGYSSIAIGIARMMGVKLMENFDQPYFSKSISEFWKRWHISLSTWFRDYVYIPLGGNRVGRDRWYFNLMLTFVLSGFWHGASWTFIIWGLLHGAFLVLSIITLNVRTTLFRPLYQSIGQKYGGALRILVVFHLVTFSWIFFRSNDLNDAIGIVKAITKGRGNGFRELEFIQIMEVSISFAAFILMELFLRAEKRPKSLENVPPGVRLSYGSVAAAILVLTLGKYSLQNFIYFQF